MYSSIYHYDIITRYVIKQVPSIRLFRKGQMFPYNGPGQHGTLTGEYVIISSPSLYPPPPPPSPRSSPIFER